MLCKVTAAQAMAAVLTFVGFAAVVVHVGVVARGVEATSSLWLTHILCT